MVAKENEDILLDAWARESEEIERKAKEVSITSDTGSVLLKHIVRVAWRL